MESREISQVESFEEFVDLGVKRLLELLKGAQVWGNLDEAVKNAREIVLASDRLREAFNRRRSWRVAVVGPNYAKLNFLASGLLKRLAELKLKYNVVKKDGELEERDLKLVKVEKGDTYLLKFPVFVRDRVVKILRELGYVAQLAEVEYPKVSYKREFSLFPFQAEAVENWVAHGMDVWLDSGVAWIAAVDGERNRELWTQLFPYDFVTEGIDQTRGWFYSLLATSVLYTGKAPYKTILIQGLILDKHECLVTVKTCQVSSSNLRGR